MVQGGGTGVAISVGPWEVMAMGWYKEIRIAGSHLQRKNGMVLEHRYEAEKMLGRHLRNGETVHHIDGDRLNNAQENLMVFTSRSDHSRFHGIAGCTPKLQGDGTYRVPARRYSCIECGKQISHSGRCGVCGAFSRRVVERPSAHDLLALIQSHSFVELGRMFGVSDNAVRKWCKTYELPYRRRDIQRTMEVMLMVAP